MALFSSKFHCFTYWVSLIIFSVVEVYKMYPNWYIYIKYRYPTPNFRSSDVNWILIFPSFLLVTSEALLKKLLYATYKQNNHKIAKLSPLSNVFCNCKKIQKFNEQFSIIIWDIILRISVTWELTFRRIRLKIILKVFYFDFNIYKLGIYIIYGFLFHDLIISLSLVRFPNIIFANNKQYFRNN